MWMMLKAFPRPCFNQPLIEDIMKLTYAAKASGLRFDFWSPGRWCLICIMWEVI
ncbi:Uncharacterised protein [Ewingella americana]|uniref:Uncharacterized protein n=1 Tax=Ewingella americana TaxID=41202 RepID=A0A377NKM6_9GAMM|nr:Uncharacterised protein [Ewingella americana]